MNALQHAMDAARLRLNAQLQEHYKGKTAPDFDGLQVDAVLAEDGRTLVLVVEFPDGFIATVGVGNFRDLLQQTKATVH